MIPVLILVLWLPGEHGGPTIETREIQFRSMESCSYAAAQLETSLKRINASAVCIDRNIVE